MESAFVVERRAPVLLVRAELRVLRLERVALGTIRLEVVGPAVLLHPLVGKRVPLLLRHPGDVLHPVRLPADVDGVVPRDLLPIPLTVCELRPSFGECALELSADGLPLAVDDVELRVLVRSRVDHLLFGLLAFGESAVWAKEFITGTVPRPHAAGDHGVQQATVEFRVSPLLVRLFVERVVNSRLAIGDRGEPLIPLD